MTCPRASTTFAGKGGLYWSIFAPPKMRIEKQPTRTKRRMALLRAFGMCVRSPVEVLAAARSGALVGFGVQRRVSGDELVGEAGEAVLHAGGGLARVVGAGGRVHPCQELGREALLRHRVEDGILLVDVGVQQV